jgi:hypothetical protein
MLHQDSYRMLRPVPFSCCLPCCLPFCLPRCLPLLPAHCANAAPPSSASSGALATLANYEGLASASDDLRTKCSRALKAVVGHLSHLPALDALVRRQLPEPVMKVVLQQVRRGVAGRKWLVAGGMWHVESLWLRYGACCAWCCTL